MTFCWRHKKTDVEQIVLNHYIYLIGISKFKVNVRLCKRKIYQHTDIKEFWSIFYQIRPVVSHIEVCLQESTNTPNTIGEAFKVTERQFWKETLFVK